jgi:glycosyltransferase involved in cell wall biosynthesis
MLLANTVYRVSVDDIPNEFNAYMLPEVTFNDSSLDIFENLLDRMPVCAIYYDSLHQTSSQLFPLSTALWTSRYFRVLYHCKHLMFISESVRNDFLKVFRYDDTCGHSAVIPLGADGIKSQIMENQETANQFICLSSLHIKKNYKVVLETFELRWSRGNQDVLVILGAEGDIDLPTLEKIRLYSNLGRVKWLNAASDAVVAAELSISKALIFVSEHEGFGLPPLEALRHKIPVIVYSRVPSICNLPELGQIRLDRIDIDSLDRALSVFDDSAKAASLKSEIDRLNLPTWNDFTSQVQKFVSNMIVS